MTLFKAERGACLSMDDKAIPTTETTGKKETNFKPSQVAIIPGNGAGDVYCANWYRWAYKTIKAGGIECRLENMPDPVIASEKVWLPFMEKELKCDEGTIIIGHRYVLI